jgi:two-component sensor histidine kinase
MSAEDAADVLREAANRVEVVGRLHRRMADHGGDAAFDVGELLRDIAEDTVASLASPGHTQLTLALSGGCTAPAQMALPIGLMVGELVTNSIKYSHPTGIPGEIGVSCAGGSAGSGLRVEVSDDGVGLPDGLDPKTASTLGLRLVRALARQMNAALVYDQSGVGLCVRLSLPSANA